MGRGYGSFDLRRGQVGPANIRKVGKTLTIVLHGDPFIEMDLYLGKLKIFGHTRKWALHRRDLAINNFMRQIGCTRYCSVARRIGSLTAEEVDLSGATHRWRTVIYDKAKNTSQFIPPTGHIVLGVPVKCVIKALSLVGNTDQLIAARDLMDAHQASLA